MYLESAIESFACGCGGAVYRVLLIESIGSSLVVTNFTAGIPVTLYRPVKRGLVPVELSTSISGSHATTSVVNA